MSEREKKIQFHGANAQSRGEREESRCLANTIGERKNNNTPMQIVVCMYRICGHVCYFT
jgi:hypothetical protein